MTSYFSLDTPYVQINRHGLRRRVLLLMVLGYYTTGVLWPTMLVAYCFDCHLRLREGRGQRKSRAGATL